MNIKELPKFMDHLTGEYGIPGNAVKIYHNHSLVYEYSSGYADIENKIPFATNQIVNVFSCSKVITCAAALTLFEKGKFLMTDELYRYIPEYKNIKVAETDSNGKNYLRAPVRNITIRDLFTMCSGLNYNVNAESILELKKKNPHAGTLDFIKAFANEPLLCDPGEHWKYSMSHDVIGGLIEAITDMPFGDYVKQAIFDKCGMENSGFSRNDDVFSKMAEMYVFDNNTKKAKFSGKRNNGYILGDNYHSGGAGVYSTADDYILFADAMACGGVSAIGERILSSETINLMRTNCLNEVQLKDFNWIQYKGYGYGLGVRTVIDKAAGGVLSPLGEFGWAGAAGSQVIIDPANRLSVFYCQHMTNPQEDYIFPRIRNIIYAELSDSVLK